MKKYIALLSEKNYVKVILANMITRLGDGIDMIAFSWLVYQVTGSTVLTATIYGVNVIPNLTIGLVSGVICQYVSEKRMMFICDIGRCICVSLIALLFMNNQLEVWHLFVITFLNSSFEAFRNPCERSIYPKILQNGHLEIGLALKESLVNSCNFLGIVIAPICIALFGLQGALIIDAASFALCGCITLCMHKVPVTTEAKITIHQCFQDLKDGFSYIYKDHFLSHVLLCFCIINALFTPLNSFESAYVKDVLHMSSIGLSVFSLGFLLGNILFSPFLPKLKEKYSGRKLTVYSILCLAVAFIAYSLLPYIELPLSYFALAIISFVIGIAISTANFPINITLYKRVEPQYMSRVQSIAGTLSMAIIPLSSFFAGGLSAILPLTTIYMICALLLLLEAIYILFNKLFYKFNEY